MLAATTVHEKAKERHKEIPSNKTSVSCAEKKEMAQ